MLLSGFLSFVTNLITAAFVFEIYDLIKLKLFRMNSLIALSTFWNEFCGIVRYTKDYT